MAGRPRLNSKAEQELDKVEEQLDAFNDKVKELSAEPAKLEAKEVEPQVKFSNREINKDAKVIMPAKTIGRRDKFNEDFRSEFNEMKQRINCIVEHIEQPGALVESWTGPWGGYQCEFWQVPVNTPVNIPKYLAKRLAACNWNILSMDEGQIRESTNEGKFYGAPVYKDVRRRIDCRPAGSSFISMSR